MYKLLFITFIILAFISCAKNETAVRPNVILILTDDQGWGDLGFNGNTDISTPNIDKLAKTGITFDRFYVCPVCSPTRAEILTGRYHIRGGVYSTSAGGERLDLDEITMADIFRNAGYATAAYGKWHNGMQPPYHPNARGFDDYYGFCSGHWGNYFDPVLEHNGEIVKGKGFIIDDLTDHGIQFIEHNKSNPFFLYLPYNTPHSPMQVPDKWWDKYENAELKLHNRDPEKEDTLHKKAALAMCENIDWNVGRISDKINELGLSQNTIIIYLSDNGPNGWRWNGGMKGRKGSTDEGGVRSPLVMKWDGKFKAGNTISQIASAIDLLPTLIDLTGIEYETEKPIDGLSLKPLLLDNGKDWEERLVINHWKKRTSVRSQQFRLDYQGKLFDMISDPGQAKDISTEKPEITEWLGKAKEKWERDVLPELPSKDNRTFPIGHPEYNFTQIPARDGIAHGNIKRSNRYPNCSFFTNWTSVDDYISWETEVLTSGKYEVEIYYTCSAENVGSVFEMSFGDKKLTGKITEAHDSVLTGMENDRVPRTESYVKDFKRLKIGTISLTKGTGTLKLKAVEIPGTEVMDFRLMMLRRI